MDTYPVQVHVRVRARDTSPGGLLDESALVVYLAEAREAYLSVLNLPPLRLRVASLQLDPIEPASVGDQLAVRARVQHLSERGLGMEYLIRDRLTRQPIARAFTSLLVVDEQARAVSLSPLLRRRVAELEGRSFPLPA